MRGGEDGENQGKGLAQFIFARPHYYFATSIKKEKGDFVSKREKIEALIERYQKQGIKIGWCRRLLS